MLQPLTFRTSLLPSWRRAGAATVRRHRLSSAPALRGEEDNTIIVHQHRTTEQIDELSSFPPSALIVEDVVDSGLRKHKQKPRLEALRSRLREEKNNAPPTLHTFGTTKNTKKNHKQKNVSPIVKDQTEEAKRKSLFELMEKLDAVPLPKEPLKDTFGRHHSYLRISLSERCNLRCLYCMPEDGVPLQPAENLLSNAEIMKLASWFNQQGVNKIRLTGGEPLLRKNLVELVADLNQLENPLEQIGMTTNGVTLSKHLPDLVDAGLTHVNISLDSLKPEKFAKLTRRPAAYFDRVMEAIEDCAKYLPNQTKINCVVMPDNADELQDFVELSRRMPVDIRFIEYMPFNDNQWGTDDFLSYSQMQEQIIGLEREEDGPNDTTKWWRVQPNQENLDKSLGRVGFITSMSEHFCGTCNRLRLTADGQLKVCLFGKTEVSLRDLMRQGGSDEMLQKVIHHSVQRKHFKLGGHKDMEDLKAHSDENRPMTLIGG
uniref:GTP 3',8-cyclase n=1 Tax=Pseudo-nitzschia australis TaxID=44445 RepID=A0A7S4AI57_9STRA